MIVNIQKIKAGGFSFLKKIARKCTGNQKALFDLHGNKVLQHGISPRTIHKCKDAAFERVRNPRRNKSVIVKS